MPAGPACASGDSCCQVACFAGTQRPLRSSQHRGDKGGLAAQLHVRRHRAQVHLRGRAARCKGRAGQHGAIERADVVATTQGSSCESSCWEKGHRYLDGTRQAARRARALPMSKEPRRPPREPGQQPLDLLQTCLGQLESIVCNGVEHLGQASQAAGAFKRMVSTLASGQHQQEGMGRRHMQPRSTGLFRAPKQVLQEMLKDVWGSCGRPST